MPIDWIAVTVLVALTVFYVGAGAVAGHYLLARSGCDGRCCYVGLLGLAVAMFALFAQVELRTTAQDPGYLLHVTRGDAVDGTGIGASRAALVLLGACLYLQAGPLGCAWLARRLGRCRLTWGAVGALLPVALPGVLLCALGPRQPTRGTPARGG